MMLQRFVQCSEKCLKYQICHLQRAHNILTVSLQYPHNVVTATLLRSWRSYSTQEVAAVLSPHTHSMQDLHSVCTARIPLTLYKTKQRCANTRLRRCLCAYSEWSPHMAFLALAQNTQICLGLLSTHLGDPVFFGVLWEYCKDATLVWQGFKLTSMHRSIAGHNP